MDPKTIISEQAIQDFLFDLVHSYSKFVSKLFAARFQGNPTFDLDANSGEILLHCEQLDLHGHTMPARMDPYYSPVPIDSTLYMQH